MDTKHSPLPWKLAMTSQPAHGESLIYTGDDPDNAHEHIAVVSGGLGWCETDARCYESEANAALIVRAVNSHAALVDALRCSESYLLHFVDPNSCERWSDAGQILQLIRAALALAEGGAA